MLSVHCGFASVHCGLKSRGRYIVRRRWMRIDGSCPLWTMIKALTCGYAKWIFYVDQGLELPLAFEDHFPPPRSAHTAAWIDHISRFYECIRAQPLFYNAFRRQSLW